MNSLHMGMAAFTVPRALQPAGRTATLKPERGMANGDGKRTSGQSWDGGRLLQDGAGLVPLRGWCTVCAARVAGMSLSGTVGWGIKTCSMPINMKSSGGKGEQRLILSRAAPRVCAPKLRLRAPLRAVVETRC